MPLDYEEQFDDEVVRAMNWGPDTDASDTTRAVELRKAVAQTVGRSHWVYVLATFAWLQKWLMRVKHEASIAIREEELMSGSTHIAAWFQACAPDNMEQRLSALFLAARLAHNLGGGLPAWGYDPGDTLGKTGRSVASRLEEHGW